MTDAVYTKQTSVVKKYPRPLGHALRSAVMLMGIWFYYLLCQCVPKGKVVGDLADGKVKKAYYMMAIGSGLLQGMAFIFFFFVLWGIRRTSVTRMIGLVLLGIYVLGGLLFIIGEGMYTDYAWDWARDGDKSAWRSELVGHLMGDACFITAGLLIILPDLGILNDYEK
eukprot:TRINITY_DN1356_c5_g1_i1.p1 TRINITY_DN1356_c5_g1~~TRINITY_DN1356_c5_g1_i1.p1  ORF type:complete len:168 (+),score=39.24 TRINITY_DN1356_c5_g1_i1:56-559(+)